MSFCFEVVVFSKNKGFHVFERFFRVFKCFLMFFFFEKSLMSLFVCFSKVFLFFCVQNLFF